MRRPPRWAGQPWLLLLCCHFQVTSPAALPGVRLDLLPAAALRCLTLWSFVCRCAEPTPGRRPIQVRGRLLCGSPPGAGLPTRCGRLSRRPTESGPSAGPLSPAGHPALCLLVLCSPWCQTWPLAPGLRHLRGREGARVLSAALIPPWVSMLT